MKLGIGAVPLKGMDDKAPGISSLPICYQTYTSNTHHVVNNIENIDHKSITEKNFSELMAIFPKSAYGSFAVLVILWNLILFYWMAFCKRINVLLACTGCDEPFNTRPCDITVEV